MVERRKKKLCKLLARTVAWLTAVMVALTGMVGYWLMARTLMMERQNYIKIEIGRQAEKIENMFSSHLAWLGRISEEIGALTEPEELEQLPERLKEWERMNGNLVHLRVWVDGLIYENGEVISDEAQPQEEWMTYGQREAKCLPVETIDGRAQVTLTFPVQREEQDNGVLAVDFSLQDLFRNISRVQPVQGGYAFLTDSVGEILSHPAVDTALLRSFPGYPQSPGMTTAVKDYDGVKRYFVTEPIALPGWKIFYGVDLRTLLQPINPVLWTLLLLTLLSFALAWFVMLWRLEMLEDPIRQIVRAAREMGRGRYGTKIPYTGEDEFGEVCRELENAMAWTAANVDEVAHALGRMGQGDFTVNGEGQGAGDFLPIWESVGKIGSAMHNVFKQVNLTAKWALGGSHQVSGVLGRLSVGIESQSNSVEELNKSATLLRHESNQNALNASHAQESALMVTSELRNSDRANMETRSALREVDEAIRGMHALLESVQRSVTNGRMLSISASAEAERIGEQAQSFVLTVDELRELFLRAMQDTKEVSERISKARTAINRAQDCAGFTVDAMKRVLQKNGQTAEFVARIASASQLQAQAATKMSKDVSVISVVIQANSQLAEQFDLSCGSLSDQAKVLSEMASVFYTKGESTEDEKSAPIIFDEDSGGFSVS